MVIAISLLVLILVLVVAAWLTDFVFQRSMRAALHRMELQIAFLAGRIGVRGEQVAAAGEREPPAGETEVTGGVGWDDREERMVMAEQAEAAGTSTDGNGNP